MGVMICGKCGHQVRDSFHKKSITRKWCKCETNNKKSKGVEE